MSTIWKVILLLIRMGSGIMMLMQGFEKLTGGFAISGLVPVVQKSSDIPDWYKAFFSHVVNQQLDLIQWMIPLGEIAIGLGLIFGVLSYTASFFGVFVMLNYILADMIFTYPIQLFFFIILLMNKKTLESISLLHFFKRKKLGNDAHGTHTYSG
ncbi:MULTISPECIES: DoxX family membrane protein [unclassified Staphylococcus]|uniref:DoxX family membrane protein n=1 Tax=unclassified Staphylococcus TaxID=91994 RepID=UPI0021D22A5E|nr:MULTISPECIES: DoxX family membrane protein [unclassified Staphylococcus]UXR71269.1 DoxX family membrane protein [Staphylococcus sp. IVB6240]UXR73544.1 DoxX family membrane protein [Staphylococcus sp. IVB6238]UXR75861.1 DoxX family membrane protein [Staphylococcus sp. IVB6233]UXR80059.1 DoxX family membrane protein [Staphylococcus sp. IVB6218]